MGSKTINRKLELGKGNNEKQRIIFIDAKNSGVSGDLLVSSLSTLFDDATADLLLEQLRKSISDNFEKSQVSVLKFEQVNKNGLFPRRLKIKIEKDPHHNHIHKMREKIIKISEDLNFSEAAKKFALAFLDVLAEAESGVHKIPKDKIHLHEIGSIDTIIDICGITMYLDRLVHPEHYNAINPARDNGALSLTGGHDRDIISNEIKGGATKVYCSPIALGGGTIKIAHGIVSVPAPATRIILQEYNIPGFGGPIEKELSTPTGAAALASLKTVKDFVDFDFIDFMPEMIIKKTGMATGTLNSKEFPNILTIYYGDLKAAKDKGRTNKVDINPNGLIMEDVAVLETTIDDVSGEMLGYLMKDLFNNGALDVNFIGAKCKKDRPCTLIKVIAGPSPSEIEALINIIIRDVHSLGVRYRIEKRLCLKRLIIKLKTDFRNSDFNKDVSVADTIPLEYRIKVGIKLKEEHNYGNNNDTSKQEYLPEDLKDKQLEVITYKVEYDDLVNLINGLLKKANISIIYLKERLENDFYRKLIEIKNERMVLKANILVFNEKEGYFELKK
ncbi:MAG: LarC family nickel insertion protein [Promethearchaeota archaeon]